MAFNAEYDHCVDIKFLHKIPIQLTLNTRKDIQLLDELLYTNWFRFAADVFQVIFVVIISWQSFKKGPQQASGF